MLPTATFTLLQQSWVMAAAATTKWPTECKIFTTWLFMGKFANPWPRQFQEGSCPFSVMGAHYWSLLMTVTCARIGGFTGCTQHTWRKTYIPVTVCVCFVCVFYYLGRWNPKQEQKDIKLLIRKNYLTKSLESHKSLPRNHFRAFSS